MEFIDCKAISQKWKDEIKATGVKACLYVISAGDDPASNTYSDKHDKGIKSSNSDNHHTDAFYLFS